MKLVMAGLSCFLWSLTLFAAERHQVVLGDTLWDLSDRFYQDPWQWKRIWQANASSIADPNLIYPGQEILIPGKEEAEAPPTEASSSLPALPPPAPTPATEPVEEAAPASAEVPRQLPSQGHVLAAQTKKSPPLFLVPLDWRGDGIVTGDRDKKDMVSMGDLVFLDFGRDRGADEGTRCAVYRSLHKLKHPKTNKTLGRVVKVIGELRIVGEAGERESTARVVWSHLPIEVGDIVRKEE